MSLSNEDVQKELKEGFVTGYRDISNQKYVGASGKHMPDEPAVETTNGAGPHNIQMFVLNADGTVLNCLPGYWAPQDLISELEFSKSLNQVYMDQSLSLDQKKEKFAQMQADRAHQDINGMHARSHLQGFDLQYEAKNNPNSDFFYNPRAIDPATGKTPPKNVKTVDIVMHERMAERPLLAYKDFDVADYASYGKLTYDKHEQYLMSNGQIAPGANLADEPMLGNTPKAHPIKTELTRTGNMVARRSVSTFLRYGIRALIH